MGIAIPYLQKLQKEGASGHAWVDAYPLVKRELNIHGNKQIALDKVITKIGNATQEALL